MNIRKLKKILHKVHPDIKKIPKKILSAYIKCHYPPHRKFVKWEDAESTINKWEEMFKRMAIYQ